MALVFHVAGDFAAYLGLDGAKNDLFYGGWSEGANKYTVLHEKNTPNRVVQVKTHFGPARQTGASGGAASSDYWTGIISRLNTVTDVLISW